MAFAPCVSPNTLPTVRAHVLTVVAAAAYATASKKDTGFRVLWKRIKPADGPEDGIPFKADDPIFDVPSTCFETEDLELAGIVRALLPLMDENGVSPFPLSAVPAISTQRNAKASEARAARPPSETESLPPYRDIDDHSATDGSVNKAKALSSYVATANDPDGVSFRQDEIVEITNQIGHWLLIQTSDGRRGISTSDYFTPVETDDSRSDFGIPPSEEKSDNTRNDFHPKSADVEDPPPPSTLDGSKHKSLEIPPKPPSPQWKVEWVGSAAATQGEVERSDLDMLPGYFDEPLLLRAGVSFKARATFSHVALQDDPEGVSFRENEIINIVDQQGSQWRVQTGDGSCGNVSSDYFDIPIIPYAFDPRSSLATPRCKYKAEALCDYAADDEEGLSFRVNEILDILHDNGDRWYARKKSGSVGQVSPRCFLALQPARALDFWQDDNTLAFIRKGEIVHIHPIGSSESRRAIKEQDAIDDSWFSVPFDCLEIIEHYVGEEKGYQTNDLNVEEMSVLH